MRHFSLYWILGIFAASLLPASLSADIVYHRNGQKLEGIVLSESDERVVIRMPAGELSLPRSVVVRVEKDDALNNAVIRIDSSFRTQNVIGGMKAIAEALEAGADPAVLNESLIRNRGNFLRGLQALRPADRTEARHQLKAIRDSTLPTSETQRILAQAFLEMEMPLEASDCLLAAGFDNLRKDDETRQWAAKFLGELVRSLVARGQYREAIEQIERLRLLGVETTQREVPLLYLTQAAQFREAENYEQALATISEKLWPVVPEIARDRTMVTMRKMTRWAERTGNERDARRWINRHVTAKMPVEALSAGHQLYKLEANRFLDNNKPDFALRLLNQLPEDERPADLQNLWLLASFHTKRDEQKSSPPELFELALWAASNKLFDESLFLLEELRENPILEPLANEQITLMRKERDLFMIQQALEAYDTGLLQDASELAGRILANPDRETDIGKQAQELVDLVQREIAVQEHNHPYIAESYYQQAERAFFMDDPDKAWNLIDLILRHYNDTPAAKRAAALVPQVMRQLELALLEGRRKTVPEFEAAVSNAQLRQSEQLDKEIQMLLGDM